MNQIPSKKTLFLKVSLTVIFFLIISLFFSAQKISIVLIFSAIFLLLKINYQKIIAINLIILTFFVKIIFLPFQIKIDQINPSKIEIYEKHFLYGVGNLNMTKTI